MGYGRLQHPSLIPTPELSVSGSRGLSRKTRNSQAQWPPPRVNSSIVDGRIYCQTARRLPYEGGTTAIPASPSSYPVKGLHGKAL